MIGRLDRARTMLAETGIDAALVTAAANRSYLSSWVTGDDGAPSGVLLVSPGGATLYTGATNLPWAAASVQDIDVAAWQRPWTTSIAAAIAEMAPGRLGIEEDALTVAAYWALRDAMPGTEIVPVGGPISALRRQKDEVELELLTRAIALTDQALEAVLPSLVPGMTEREVAAAIGRALTGAGADGAAFPTIVASGPHAARPHHDPTDRPIATGEPVIIDMGALVSGYHGDLTRTVWLGDADERLRTIYPIVLAAHDAAWTVARAGVTGRSVHDAAAGVIAAAGYGEYYPHGTGHGIGLQIHEGPSCGDRSTDVLRVGDVITIEPGIYLPDWGGVRIEDAGVVGADGLRRLTGAPKVSP
ncbi:MAG: Xaa-Pro peptidase family protein [Thermomicrobiales bacterium]